MSTMFSLFLFHTALADGGYHDDGSGCDAGLFFLVIVAVFVIVGLIVIVTDQYKMKTDPAYRAHAEQIRRKVENQRRYGP